MDDLTRLLLALLYQLVGELLVAFRSLVLVSQGWSALLLLAHHGDGLFAGRRVSGHVPLFVVGDITWVRYDCAHYRHNQVRGSQRKENSVNHGLILRLLHLILIVCPR